MDVAAVSTADRSLLHAVRRTIGDHEQSLLAIAFVRTGGVYLVEPQLRKAERARLLTTTAFGSTESAALDLAARAGTEVLVLNPGGGTYHPKLYLGRTDDRISAVVGSSNLTHGLVSNVEVATWMQGTVADDALARLWEWASARWEDPRATPYTRGTATAPAEHFAPDLWPLLSAEVASNPLFLTLGSKPMPNHVVELTPEWAAIETAASRKKGGGPQRVPAWMFNMAWMTLKNHGQLTNHTLLNELRVHRSSAVCAILARTPHVSALPKRAITLVWSA